MNKQFLSLIALNALIATCATYCNEPQKSTSAAAPTHPIPVLRLHFQPQAAEQSADADRKIECEEQSSEIDDASVTHGLLSLIADQNKALIKVMNLQADATKKQADAIVGLSATLNLFMQQQNILHAYPHERPFLQQMHHHPSQPSGPHSATIPLPIQYHPFAAPMAPASAATAPHMMYHAAQHFAAMQQFQPYAQSFAQHPQSTHAVDSTPAAAAAAIMSQPKDQSQQ